MYSDRHPAKQRAESVNISAQIGFVSFFWAWESRRDASGTGDWVRFAHLCRGLGGGTGAVWKLGSFRIFGGA